MSNIIYYNSQDVMAEYDTYYAEGYRAWGQKYPAMALSLRQYLGDQWTMQEKNDLKEQGRHAIVINRMKAKIDWLDGYQIQNRLSSVVLPLKDGNQQTADQRTKVLLYVLQQYDGYKYISETFGAGNKTAWSMLNAYLDYTEDPHDGDVRFGRDPYSAIMLDPYFTKLSLDDCNWVIKRKYLSPTQAQVLLPGQEDEVMQLARDGWERDNKFTWMVFQRVPTGQRMMAFNEFWRMKYEPQKVVVNKTTGLWSDFNGSKEDMRYIQYLAAQQNHELEVITRKKRFVEKHVILNNNYMRTEINPYGLDEYPFALYTPIFEPESEEYTYKLQSLVDLLIDPQREYNRRRSQMIDFVESQLNTGWIEEEGAVLNPQMLYQAGQGRRVVRRKGTTPDSIQKIQSINIPESWFAETKQADSDLMEVLGMNPTMFGEMQTKQVSALVELQRQAAGLTGQQYIFENLREMQKYISRKIVKITQKWSKAKLQKILGEEPTPDFADPDSTKYDVTVTEGILTDTQKRMFFQQVLELKQLQEPIPPGELTKLAPLQGKTEFMKDVQSFTQQQQQMAQTMQQRELAESQGLTQSLQSKAMSDQALAASRIGEIDERKAKAQLDRDQAILERIKAIQELEKMSADARIDKDSHLMRMLEFFQAYEQYQKQQEQPAQQQGEYGRPTQGQTNPQATAPQTTAA